MAFQIAPDSFRPPSPMGPLYSLPLPSPVSADENGSRNVTQAQLANVFRFQDLPPEMRNEICKHALVPENNHRLRFMPGTSGSEGNRFQVITHGLAYEAQWGRRDRHYRQLYTALPLTQEMSTEIALAHTNRQLYYSDALSIFYGYTRFHFDTLKEIRTFIANVPVHCRNKIRDISFRYSNRHRRDAQVALFELVKHLTSLKKITIIFHEEEWRQVKNGVRKYDGRVKYEGVRLLLLLKRVKELRLEGDADRLATYFAENMTSKDKGFKIINSGRRVWMRNGVAVTAPGTAQTKSQRAEASKDGDMHA
ncbi:hypothetical protein D0863_14936 [Hortaea werneckii]|uniref:DUF7730 domain-containing protein n=1 Tax=Hortaea werneckii TaxID=91943 RepID=A0A3M7CEZ3_HORWE|nr:hypothetical protein D0863_14936 [Hortaea werneckii]